MCDGRKDKSHKHIDEPFKPQPNQQPSPFSGYQPPPAPMGYEIPKYAEFEVGKSGLAVEPKKSAVHEDALPAMPSWEGATVIRSTTTDHKDEGMELGHLTPDGQNIPLMSGAAGAHSPGATSPSTESSAYFGGRGAQGQNGYMQGQPGGNMPYGPAGMNRNGSPAMMNGRGGPGMNGRGGMNGPGMNGAGMNGRGMNGPGYGAQNNGVNTAMGGPSRDQYGQPISPQGYNNQRPGFPPAAGYRGPPQRQYSNDPNSPYARGQPQPQRQYSNNSEAPYPNGGPQRQFSGNNGFPLPGPQRQYSSDGYRPSQDMHRPPASPSSPLNNSGGFDFNLGSGTPVYEMPSQPQSQANFEVPDHSNYAPSTAAPSYATRAPQQQQRQYSPSSPSHEFHYDQQRSYSPEPQEVHEMPSSELLPSRPDGGPAYPGYKPYSPAPQEAARNTPPPPNALMPGRPNY